MSALSTVCQVVRYFNNIVGVFSSIDKLLEPENQEDSAFRTASIATKCFILMTTTGELVGLVKGSTSSTLKAWKMGEYVGRLADLPLSLITSIVNSKPDWQIYEELASGICSLIRVANEGVIYQELGHLDLSSDELAKIQRPIYDSSSRDPSSKIIGWRLTSVEECQQILQRAQEIHVPLAVTEVALQSGLVSTGIQAIGITAVVAQDIYNNMYARFQQRVGDVASLDLLASSIIPEELHEDIVFRRYTCPLTLAPIRHPVGDPNGVTIYERSAIEAWLLQRQRSPITQSPLHAEQLLLKPALQIMINNRLEYYTQQFRAVVIRERNAPINQALQRDVNQENPRIEQG